MASFISFTLPETDSDERDKATLWLSQHREADFSPQGDLDLKIRLVDSFSPSFGIRCKSGQTEESKSCSISQAAQFCFYGLSKVLQHGNAAARQGVIARLSRRKSYISSHRGLTRDESFERANTAL